MGTPEAESRARKEEEIEFLDVDKMLAELRMEREQIEEAILTLERLARGRGRRRGRPPAWLKNTLPRGADDGSISSGEGAQPDLSFVSEPRRRGRPPGSSNKHKIMLATHAAEN